MKVQNEQQVVKAIKIIPYEWPLCQVHMQFTSDTDYHTTKNVPGRIEYRLATD